MTVYYVKGRISTSECLVDVGIEVQEETPYMAAIAAFKAMASDFDVDNLTITEVNDK